MGLSRNVRSGNSNSIRMNNRDKCDIALGVNDITIYEVREQVTA